MIIWGSPQKAIPKSFDGTGGGRRCAQIPETPKTRLKQHTVYKNLPCKLFAILITFFGFCGCLSTPVRTTPPTHGTLL